MNTKIINGLKIIASVIVGIVAGVVAFVLMIASTFVGYSEFYSLIIVLAYLSFLGVLLFWNLAKPKLLVIPASLLLVCITCGAALIGYDRYIESIPVVKESKVNLHEYKPFSPHSKAARLENASSYTLTTDLPKIDGATALYPLYASFVNATYPKDDYDPTNSIVLCSTTPKAFENLLNKTVDIIFCAEPSKEQERMVAEKGMAFHLTPIGKEAFVFFVNAKNPVNSISSKHITDIYSGKVTNWKELGGKNSSIKVFQRPKNSGSQTILEKIMKDEQLIEPLKADVVDGMGGIIERTADYRNFKNAIGYSFLYYSTQMVNNGAIKLLAIDHIVPSKETIQNNSYPYVSNFYAITCGNEPETTKAFIQWILSNEGQYLVEKTGYIPINTSD